MSLFSLLGGKVPKVDSTIRLQFKEYTVITVEPDQDPSVSMMRMSVANRFSVKLSALLQWLCVIFRLLSCVPQHMMRICCVLE